jgi:integrase
MGIYKRCPHKGRDRDRCDDPWYASYVLRDRPRARVALAKWTGRDVRTKTDALKAFDDLKTEIRAGRYSPDGLNVSRPNADAPPATFAYLLQQYQQHYVKAKQLRTEGEFNYRTKVLMQEFADTALAELTTARIEDWQATLRARAKAEGKSVAWVNRPVSLLRAILNWGVKRQYLDTPPDFALDKEDYSRWRRVSRDEETRLLDHADPVLRALIVIALDTGMRRGEMLALRVGDVDLDAGVIRLRGTTTKDAETRDLPILTERLRGVLAWLRQGDREQPRPALAPLILDAAGEPLADFRYHWARCRLLAYGFTPKYNSVGAGLTAACRAQLQQIDLHWHDLRHEFACRLDDNGNSLGRIQRMLGHANIGTTERYLRRGLKDLQAIRLDDGALPPCVIPGTTAEAKSGRPPVVVGDLRKTGTSD